MPITKGLIHCHSENSLKDSPLSVTKLVNRAYELGAPAVTLTDHGVLTGIFELFRACNAINKNAAKNDSATIKPIPGVELYIQEDGDARRQHLVLLAKNYKGYQAISRIVTASNTNIIKDIPCATRAMIEKYCGEGSIGHGNVIATSACVAGVLASVILRNEVHRDAIAPLLRRAGKYEDPNSEASKDAKRTLDEKSAEVVRLAERCDELKPIAAKKYAMRERGLVRLSGTEYNEAKAALETEKAETEAAQKELTDIKAQLKAARKAETLARKVWKEIEESNQKWLFIQKDIQRLEAAMSSDEDLYTLAKDAANWFVNIFGADFFVELQYHGIELEKKAMPVLAKLAKEMNLPVVVANDVHFANNSPDDVLARRIVNASRFLKWMEERDDDGEYYIKSDDELRAALAQILPDDIIDQGFNGIAEIVSRCNVEMPHEKHYPKYIGEDGVARLRRLTEEGIKNRYPNRAFPYRDRVEYELSVIEKMNYSDYLCIVAEYIGWGREIGTDCPEKIGYTVGPGRGSAAGSLVCYLIGITSLDPMKYGLMFERFLNPNRVTSPDIDVDFANYIREQVIDRVKEKYGESAICGIMTKGTLAAKKAVQTVYKVFGDRDHGDNKAYQHIGEQMNKMIPNVPKIKLKDVADDIRAAFANDPKALEILEGAMLVEGVAITYGQHAAGIIIADNGDVGEYVPLMWNADKGKWCCQCDMIEAEEQAGLLKFDFLGLRNLDIVTDALRFIYRRTGKRIDVDMIPQDPIVFRDIFANAQTDFVFQFESNGMKNLLRNFRPENLEHLILLCALFRPGPLQYADKICDVKNKGAEIHYICDAARDILEVTYGFPIYQEQIMALCNQVAGFSLGEADIIRRYMSKKKEEEMAKYQPKFIDGLLTQSVQRSDAEAFWDELMNFASYSFNKSHSAVYSYLAYITGWLKYHYPTEYMAAILRHAPSEDLAIAVEDCGAMGIPITPPNINRSLEDFTCEGDAIIFGLGNIKGIGTSAQNIIQKRQESPFISFKDFLTRVIPKKNVVEALIDAGAFDEWCSNRAAIKAILPTLMDDLSKINKKSAELAAAKTKKKRDSAKARLKLLQERFASLLFPIDIPEDKEKRLMVERELLGMYVSGHPIDQYEAQRGDTPIAKVEATDNRTYVTVCGIVTHLSIKKRQGTGEPMAFFDLEDRTSSIHCCCFTKAYAEIGHLIEEGAALRISGSPNKREYQDVEIVEIYVSTAKKMRKQQNKICISVPGMHAWAELYPDLRTFIDKNGADVYVWDEALCELRSTNIRLNEVVLSALQLNTRRF